METLKKWAPPRQVTFKCPPPGLSPNLRKYCKAIQEMNDWLEKDDVPEDTTATMYSQQLQRVKQLKNQVFRPEPSPVQMITQTEQTMT